MMRARSALLTLSAFAFLAAPAWAQDGDTSSCDLIADLVASGDYADALFELDICESNVRKRWYDGMVDVVNVPIEGIEPGDASVEGAMGISVVTFEHGPWESTFTSGTGGAENPMSGLAALAGGLSGAFGVQQDGVEDVRLGRRLNGRLETDGDELTMTVGLDDGVLVTKGEGDRDQLIALVRAITEILDEYLG